MASTPGNQEVARRYATALFDFAKEQGGLDRVADDLQSLKGMIAGSKDFNLLLTNATLQRKDQERAILALADEAKFAPPTRQFLGLLAFARRLPELPAIIDAVQAEIEQHKGEITAQVIAAQSLDKAQVDSIAAALKKILSLNVKIKLTEDVSILGGLVVRVGSKLIDSSVRTKLERLTRTLKSQDQSRDKTRMKEVA